ncbi:MAG: tRNA (cytidine(34)-2'-O)-methyltransferase [Chlamydiota bacterium]
MKVILYEPQIPQNTGNIVRTCKVTGSDLTLVKPLGFSITDRALKRAGLDYWDGVSVEVIDNLLEYLSHIQTPFYFLSSHAKKSYTEVAYTPNDLLIFGSETAGLPSIFLEKWPELFITLPMMNDSRCLNLANTVSIVLYEAWRQQGFQGQKNENT